jgi:dipeptidyl aminopeptidase/acylaminoacyl peptidase
LSDANIWRLEVPGVSKTTTQPVSLISSTYAEDSPRYSPDGKRIAFQSGRSGHPEIWVCGSDGSNPVRLTSLRAVTTGSPHWSPDGNQIVFDSDVEGHYGVYVIDAGGGRPRRVTDSLADNAVANWSRDGRWIYFFSNRAKGTWHDGEIWRMPAAGGEVIQVTRQGAHIGFESFDGRYIYFTKEFGETTLWRVPAGGGAEEKVQESVWGQAFDVTRSGIYFAALRTDGSSTIQFRSFATGKVATIAAIRRPVGWGLSVSPDERYILYTQEDRAGSDLMLMENFR